ncbi:phage tail protein [Nocardia sp. NPDC046473]|uniref:phage tail protein n=1 Tax=Nocardia sp. NPDC046473 TaxID=3155733 RepID=UPI0033F9DD49
MADQAVPAPDATYRYRCTIGGETVAFNSASGLEMGVETIEYKDGLGNWFQMPGQASAVNITLRRGAPGSVSGVWKQWAEGVSYDNVDKRDLSIA